MVLKGWLVAIETRQAVERNFDIIEDALNRLSRQDPTLADPFPNLAQIISFRNFLTHEYDSIDPEVVWSTVKNNLPELHAYVRDLIAELETTNIPDPPRSGPSPF